MLTLAISCLSSCQENENLEIETSQDSSMENLYKSMSNAPTYSVNPFNRPTILSRSEGLYNGAIPVFSPATLDSLANMSVVELQKIMTTYTDALEAAGLSSMIDDCELENTEKIYTTLGDRTKYDELLEFMNIYLISREGFSTIRQLMPKTLNEAQSKIYLAMAVYIDKIGRPIIDHLYPTSIYTRANETYCKWEAAAKLSVLGVNIGVDAFLDVVTAGGAAAFTDLELDITMVGGMEIFYSYEACCGRIH